MRPLPTLGGHYVLTVYRVIQRLAAVPCVSRCYDIQLAPVILDDHDHHIPITIIIWPCVAVGWGVMYFLKCPGENSAAMGETGVGE